MKSQETGRPEELLFIYSSSPVELFDAINTRMPCHERAFPLGLIAPSLFIVLSFLKNVKREHLTKMDFARIHLIECKSALFAA